MKAVDAAAGEAAPSPVPRPPSPLAALAARARHLHDSQLTALLWLPSPSPDGTAADRIEWSYAQLWARATAAAAQLRDVITPLNNNHDAPPPPPPSLSALLSPEHRAHTVGVMVEEGPGMAVAELAVMLAGAAVVPLGAADPPARLRCVLEDAGCVAVIAAPGHNPAASERLLEAVRSLPSSRRGVIVVDVANLLNGVNTKSEGGGGGGAAESESSEGTTRLCLDPPPGKLSHVFFTSGSTGRPKGCLATHGALAHYCRAKNHAHGVTAGAVVLVASPHTFDPSLGGVVASLPGLLGWLHGTYWLSSVECVLTAK
jgi:acyl-CoA synthetase (AMP-forming)/AMP-acid ligase II